MRNRKYVSYSIEQLEEKVEQSKNSEIELREIQYELGFRHTKRAKKLKDTVDRYLLDLIRGVSTAPPQHSNANSYTGHGNQAGNGKSSVHKASFDLTAEQKRVIAAFQSGKNIKVNAFAGSGKTSTLVEIGKATHRRGLYLSFNKRNASEAKAKFPTSVEYRTTHALAVHSIRGKGFTEEKLYEKLTSAAIRHHLKIEDVEYAHHEVVNGIEEVRKFLLRSNQIASIVRTIVRKWMYSPHRNFEAVCHPLPGGIQYWPQEIQTKIGSYVLRLCSDCWRKMSDPSDPLPLSHDGYVKYWSLESPRINASFVLLDEAQDTNPVVLEVLRNQQCQIVYVGDRHQQIYEWRGAVNAMDEMPAEETLHLTQSFRFGNAIAELANILLRYLGEKSELRGFEAIHSRVGETNAQAVLCRTNAALLTEFIRLINEGKRVAIQGGTEEQVQLLRGLEDIQHGKGSTLTELAGIQTWDELKKFIETDEGKQIATLVILAETYSIPKLLSFLRRSSGQDDCDVLLSTLHKAKGLEWDRVELLSDFVPKSSSGTPTGSLSEEDARVLYVAITRARRELQIPDDLSEFLQTLGSKPIHTNDEEAGVNEPPQTHMAPIDSGPRQVLEHSPIEAGFRDDPEGVELPTLAPLEENSVPLLPSVDLTDTPVTISDAVSVGGVDIIECEKTNLIPPVPVVYATHAEDASYGEIESPPLLMDDEVENSSSFGLVMFLLIIASMIVTVLVLLAQLH